MLIKKFCILLSFFSLFGLNVFYCESQSKKLSILINVGEKYSHNYRILNLSTDCNMA